MDSPVFNLPAPFTVRDCRGRLAERVDGLGYRTRSLAAILGIVAHATEADMSAENLALYQTTKVEGDPYPAIAYHLVVRADGVVEWCHDFQVETWHAGLEGSTRYVAVCWVGADQEAGATPAQVAAGRALVTALAELVGRPLVVQPHTALMPFVACPGPSWPRWGPSLTADEGESLPLHDNENETVQVPRGSA